ncbi:MAG: FtsQ-type POTRA domain-containing protein [Clostridia bacterium]|nr:FtsQ-type POTRA domain-containing protein [Clostridia bacterium]
MNRGQYGNDYSDYNGRDSEQYLSKAAERKIKYKKKRIIRRRIIASILIVLFIVVVLFVVSLFIRVKEVNITGNFGRYSYDEVLEAAGIKVGDRLIYMNTETIENDVEKALPYMVNVDVKRQLFNKVFIEVDTCGEAYCLYTCGKFVVVNSEYKVLRFEDNLDETPLLTVYGLEAESVSVGLNLKFLDGGKTERFEKIKNGLQGEPFGKLTVVDVSDNLNLKAKFENGFEIEFGNHINLDYNLQWAGSVVAQLKEKHDEVNGTLDLKIFKSAYYTPRSSGEDEMLSDTQV